MYRRDGGSFDPTTINLSNNAPNSIDPDIAVSGSNVHVVWSERTAVNLGDIFYRRSTDGGATFEATKVIYSFTGDVLHPSIAVVGSNVYIVHEIVESAENTDIFFTRSTDGGNTFGCSGIEACTLSVSEGLSIDPDIVASGNNVYVVWQDNSFGNDFEILYRRSTDGGVTFSCTGTCVGGISNNVGNSRAPTVAVSGSNVYVAWIDNTETGNFETLYRRSIDSGASFDNSILNLSMNTGDSSFPAIAASGNDVYLVWQDNASGNDELLYRGSVDGGTSFISTVELSDNVGRAINPSISIGN